MNILIIEDNKRLSYNIKDAFISYKFCNRVDLLWSYDDFLNDNQNINTYDIILLDINLGSLNNNTGLDILRHIRKTHKHIPIIIMSSYDGYSYIENAFLMGAHDYISKPFRNRELKIRIERWFRNYIFSEYFSLNSKLIYSDITYNLSKHQFSIGDTEIILPKGLKYIFSLLFVHREKLVKQEFLVEKIWGTGKIQQFQCVRVNIMRLKNKLKPYGLDQNIFTIRGEGYIFKR